MNVNQRYEIATLAEDLHTKKERVNYLRMLNTPLDPEERRRAAIDLALAETEAWEAETRLSVAKVNVVYGFSGHSR